VLDAAAVSPVSCQCANGMMGRAQKDLVRSLPYYCVLGSATPSHYPAPADRWFLFGIFHAPTPRVSPSCPSTAAQAWRDKPGAGSPCMWTVIRIEAAAKGLGLLRVIARRVWACARRWHFWPSVPLLQTPCWAPLRFASFNSGCSRLGATRQPAKLGQGCIACRIGCPLCVNRGKSPERAGNATGILRLCV